MGCRARRYVNLALESASAARVGARERGKGDAVAGKARRRRNSRVGVVVPLVVEELGLAEGVLARLGVEPGVDEAVTLADETDRGPGTSLSSRKRRRRTGRRWVEKPDPSRSRPAGMRRRLWSPGRRPPLSGSRRSRRRVGRAAEAADLDRAVEVSVPSGAVMKRFWMPSQARWRERRRLAAGSPADALGERVGEHAARGGSR